MKVAILRESKRDKKGREVENRVVLPPNLATKLKNIELMVETKAGEKIGHSDQDYEKIGARIVSHSEALTADLILGVKETQKDDFPYLKPHTIFMSYQHFAESKERTTAALRSKATFICLETIEVDHKFPCLAPMSEAAARVLVRHADWFALHSSKTIGCGLSQTGFKKLKVTVLGMGTVGRTAAQEFKQRGYEVAEIDRPNISELKNAIKGSFFAVSSMYIAGASPQKLITKELLRSMQPGGCVYPVDIDQGGGIEGAVLTSILDPFDLPKIEGTDIYCFAPPNLPSLGARTTSEALGSAILPYVDKLIRKESDPALDLGVNIQNGRILHAGLASIFPK